MPSPLSSSLVSKTCVNVRVRLTLRRSGEAKGVPWHEDQTVKTCILRVQVGLSVVEALEVFSRAVRSQVPTETDDKLDGKPRHRPQFPRPRSW